MCRHLYDYIFVLMEYISFIYNKCFKKPTSVSFFIKLLVLAREELVPGTLSPKHVPEKTPPRATFVRKATRDVPLKIHDIHVVQVVLKTVYAMCSLLLVILVYSDFSSLLLTKDL